MRPAIPAVTRISGPDEAREAERAELHDFVVEHHRRLVRLAGIVCVSAADAQDAVQNGLLRAWRFRHTQADPSRRRAWIDAIVVREAIRLNSRWRRLLHPLVPGVDRAGPSLDPAARSDLAAALERLSPPQRAAIALHHEAGYSVAETAELLRAPIETVRSRLRLARERLRRELAEEDHATA